MVITEKDAWYIHGLLAIVILLVSIGVAVLSFMNTEFTMGVIFSTLAIILLSGFTIIQPNQAIIVQLAGKYVGTYRHEGMVMFVPFSKRKRVSLRERIFQSKIIEVHDVVGAPVSMSMVILFKIVDAAKAVFDVEDMENYIAIQSEMSLRNLMIKYAYEDLLTDEQMLQQITKELKNDLYERLHRTGIDLTEMRLIPATVPEQLEESKEKNQQFGSEPNESLQLTENILQWMEKEKLIDINEEKKSQLLHQLTGSLTKES